MSNYNIILDTDSYKSSHWAQYMPNTTSVFSYIESRGGLYDKTVFFGLQYILKSHLTQKVIKEQVEEAAYFFRDHGEPFNEAGWMHIVNGHDGHLPLRIRAVSEGCVVPTSNILVSVENTCSDCFWLTSWVETALMRVWYPTNVATLDYHIKSDILSYLQKTSDDPDTEINFKLHDFGSRGVSSQESAAIGGAAHLVNFMGSDTVVGVRCANHFYYERMAGFSIPAAEHSTISSWGRDNEVGAYRNMLTNFAKPGKLVAVVSDTWDIYNACNTLWGGELRDEVIQSGATVVIRPDSGNPPEVVAKCLLLLDEKFGHTVNSKGYRVLNNVRVIQGDGINQDSINHILKAVTDLKYSATNIAFGMGGCLLQHHNRDTQKFAMKCSHVVTDGKSIDVYKDPITDPGKRSKSGRLDLLCEGGEKSPSYTTVRIPDGLTVHPKSVMNTVFLNGTIGIETSLADVRSRVNATR